MFLMKRILQHLSMVVYPTICDQQKYIAADCNIHDDPWNEI